MKMGERVFVHGGSGGVGSCVVQMARAIGAGVMTTAGNEDKVQICRNLGADVVVNYKTGNVNDGWAVSAASIFGGRACASRISIGHRSPGHPRADDRHGRPGRQARAAGGSVLYPRCPDLWICHVQRSRRGAAQAAAEINRWLARGKLRPQIDRVMKLSETAEAHKLQESSTFREGLPGRQDRAGAVRERG